MNIKRNSAPAGGTGLVHKFGPREGFLEVGSGLGEKTTVVRSAADKTGLISNKCGW